MKCNLGRLDRIIRIVLGIIIALIALFYSTGFGLWTYVLLVIALIFVVIAIIGYCPIYVPFGINTNKKKK